MGDEIKIRLTAFEIVIAAHIGVQRHMRSLIRNDADHGYGTGGWDNHIEGVAAEMATAKYLGVYHEPRIDVFNSKADIGRNLDVRRRSRDEWDLLIRHKDSDEHDHVLVTGKCPEFTIWGWMNGAEVKHHKEWFRELPPHPPAWFVPKENLRPMNQLYVHVEDERWQTS